MSKNYNHNPQYPKKEVYRALFLEERIFLNKSCTKWVSIGIQPRLNGVFKKAVRIAESDTSFISFDEDEIKYLMSKLGKDRELNGYEYRDVGEPWDVEENWMDYCAPEDYKKRDETILLKKTAFNDSIYQLGNKKTTGYPQYIQIGRSSLEELFKLGEFLCMILRNKKEKFAQDSFFNLIEKYKSGGRKERFPCEQLKGFLSFECSQLCGKNNLLYSITRDAFTNCYEYSKYAIESRLSRPKAK